MVDIFERLEKNAGGPIGMYTGTSHSPNSKEKSVPT